MPLDPATLRKARRGCAGATRSWPRSCATWARAGCAPTRAAGPSPRSWSRSSTSRSPARPRPRSTGACASWWGGGIRGRRTSSPRRCDALRQAGLSRQKALYLRDLSERVRDGLKLRALGRLENEAVIEALTEVKGIGRWTVEMFLIFRLGRLDVLPVHDYGIRKAMQRAYRFRKLPNPERDAPPGRAVAPVPDRGLLVPLAEPGLPRGALGALGPRRGGVRGGAHHPVAAGRLGLVEARGRRRARSRSADSAPSPQRGHAEAGGDPELHGAAVGARDAEDVALERAAQALGQRERLVRPGLGQDQAELLAAVAGGLVVARAARPRSAGPPRAARRRPRGARGGR